MRDVWTIVLIIACLPLLPGCSGVNVAADPVNQGAPVPATAQQPVSEPPVEQPPIKQPPIEQLLIEQPSIDQPPIEQQWGIEIQGLRLTSADYILDFRYRVTDPAKAQQLLKRGLKPWLLDKATGAKMYVPRPPKVGPLRTTALKPQKNKTYYVMFANPGKFIKRGAMVDVIIGDFVAKDIAVQ